MPRKEATQIKLSEHEEKILVQLKVGTHSEMHLKKRSEIVLLANSGDSNNSIEKKLSISTLRTHYANFKQENQAGI